MPPMALACSPPPASAEARPAWLPEIVELVIVSCSGPLCEKAVPPALAATNRTRRIVGDGAVRNERGCHAQEPKGCRLQGRPVAVLPSTVTPVSVSMPTPFQVAVIMPPPPTGLSPTLPPVNSQLEMPHGKRE